MNIAIRTRRLKLRAPYRERIERYLERSLKRERGGVMSATLYLSPTRSSGATPGFVARLVLTGPQTGRIIVSAEAPRLGAAIRQATRRGRIAMRERLKRRFVNKRSERAWRRLHAA